ncbi:MAG: response regulator transcription factor [Lachnospiraceae bacterium]|nr:response regulator transcription factor [Lachnospiraceae bacterium]
MKYSIFIIEDDITIRNELSTLLSAYKYQVSIIENFETAAEDVISQSPHLVLLDLNLPGADGFSICREIRKSSQVPIIIVTSRDSDMDELMSLHLGADQFISKPYNVQILLAKINALINRAYPAEASHIVRYEDISLDFSRCVVLNKEKEVELTKNEMRILQLLIEKQGHIVSRDEIMNALWQTDSFIDDNTLTVNINRLRGKLNGVGSGDLIKTRRGLGYSL